MKKRILVIALALVFVITVVPSMAKPKVYGGDVMGYMFTEESPVWDDWDATFCWEPDPSEPGVAADKYSFEVYGMVEFSVGQDDPMVEEVDFSFGTTDTCYELDTLLLEGLIEQWLWDEYELLPVDLSELEAIFSAKVKGLDPAKKLKKRQDNVWSEPIEDFFGFSFRTPATD
jgi:hypothetical protein